MVLHGHTVLFVTSLLMLGVMILKYYWKVQMMYNSSVLSFYTPDTFPIAQGKEESYEEICDLGEKYASTQKVIITSLLRDVADRLPEIKRKAERVGSLFKDYKILIVENDSTDRTRDALLLWAKENPKVTILGCGYNVKECKLPKMPKTQGHGVDRPRIEKMVKLRNVYLDEIKQLETTSSEWNYTIMWDLDMIGSIYLDGVMHTMGLMSRGEDISVVCAYGIYRWGALTLFYDTYALLHRGESFQIEDKTIHDIRKGWWEAKYQRGDDPFEVDSCFSGFAIYRTASIIDKDTIYDMSGPENLECEHVRLNKKIKGRKLVNPSMLNFVLLND
jgi:hypothetical protein